MADQAERVILEAEDEVTPVVNKANSGLDSFEKKAESSHGKVIRITDQTRSSIQRLIASLEKQAETYGKSGVDRLIAQRDSLLQRYAKEPAAIDAITRSYERMIETQKRVDAEAALEKQARSVQTFGERISQSIENPVQGAGSAVGSLLTKIGPLGVGLAAGATAITGFAVATWDAVKSLGEYGVRVKDAELRTGLTAKEVGQFGFAARAVGEDVSIFERLMRGLTGAVEDTGKEGEKARTWLTRFGVAIQGVRTGVIPTSEVLLQVASGMEKLPPGFDRTRVAMDLFKRVGIEAIPVMDGLKERVDRAKSLGFGITEADVKKYEELNKKAVEFEMRWESAIRSVKGMLLDLASAFGWILDKIATKPPTPSKQSLADQQQHAARVAALETQGQAALEARSAALQKQMDQHKPGAMDWAKAGVAGLGAYLGINIPVGSLSSSAQQYGQAASQLQYVKEALDALQNKPKPHAPLGEPPTGGGENQFESAMRQARRELAATNSDRFAAISAERQEAISDAIEKFKGKAGPLVELLKQVYDAKWLKEYNSEQEKTTKELDEQSKRWTELLGKSAKVSGEVFKQDIAEGTKKLEEQAKAVGKLSAEWNKLAAARESQSVAHEKRMIQIGADANDPLGTLAQMQALDRGQIEQRRQAALAFLPSDPLQRTMQQANAEKEAANALGELRYQWEEKVAEVRKKADQEQQDMLDKQEKSIEKVSEKLFDTLFTKPKEFGKDLANTIHAAVLKPIVEGVSGMAANVLHPVIYGEDGKGGLAGIFKGMFGAGKSGDPVKVSTDQNTAATIQNSAHMAALTAVLAGAMGVSAPAIAAPSIPGISLPRISAVSVPTRMAVTGGGTGSVGGGDAAATVAAVAGPSFSDLANLPMNHDRIAQTLDMSAPISQSGPNGTYSTAAMANLPMNHDPVAQILAMAGVGKLGGGGASSLVSNLKSSVWNQKEFTALQGAGNSGFVSGLGAVAKSPAAGAAGMMLAESGLLGSHMGSWAGVGMGALGGAAIGFQMGGPLGALIGGVAGFGIGIGEKLAGIESPQKKAHDDIKQIYGVDIPQNSGTVKQVVSIAQSQFGGDIAVAVRSPNVRQLVMLYSEATGQKMPLSASTPYAGSLVESGGNLYQQASFQGNAWHSYASNLPTLGGIAGTPYPTTPGPNTGAGSSATYLSLNINGTPITADYVADQSMAAQNASYGRTQQSANLQVPGLMVA